ncbi:hypothetical protein ANN_07358, partial [Periplaneta americana]
TYFLIYVGKNERMHYFCVVFVFPGFLTECYDELGTRYQVPVYCLSYPINIVKEDNGRDSPAECSGQKELSGGWRECGSYSSAMMCALCFTEPVDGGTEIILKLRLSSTCMDVKLPVSTKDTIGMAKKKLQNQEGLEPSRQRWFFGGKLLGDKLRVEEAKIMPGYVVQVIVNHEQVSKVDS